ncbi:MAG: Phage Tail Collar Domain protein [Gemmatimonadetes bacterium]|nr:Phage Tail Collar Domain protein [Gemmatimonadota bacterium]
MSSPYIGEIRLFGGNFAPQGWAFCDGAIVAISDNDALFQLIGTTYGGDGQSTFALPNLMGRVPIHQGQGSGLTNYQLAETGGVDTVTLNSNQMPNHSHAFVAATDIATGASPVASLLGESPTMQLYDASPAGTQNLALQAVSFTGGSQPHMNAQPYLALNYIISLYGIFPSP